MFSGDDSISPCHSLTRTEVSMCYKCEHPEMAGVHDGHLAPLTAAAPEVANITHAMHTALSTHLNPHLPALTALVAMVESLKRRDFGVLGEHRLVRLPLSIIGADKVRYRTPIVEHLHESILSLRMSDLTVETLRRALKPYGACVLFLCSCGVVVGQCTDVHAYYGSDEHARMDRLRSAIDADANPVVQVDSFDEIAVQTMDLHANGAEHRLFARIEELTRIASVAGYPTYPWLDAELERFVQTADPVSAAA